MSSLTYTLALFSVMESLWRLQGWMIVLICFGAAAPCTESALICSSFFESPIMAECTDGRAGVSSRGASSHQLGSMKKNKAFIQLSCHLFIQTYCLKYHTHQQASWYDAFSRCKLVFAGVVPSEPLLAVSAKTLQAFVMVPSAYLSSHCLSPVSSDPLTPRDFPPYICCSLSISSFQDHPL